MTETTTKDPNVVAHKFACVLATIHTAFLADRQDMVSVLLSTLPIAMDDPDLHDTYYSEGVDAFLKAAGDVLTGQYDDDPVTGINKMHDLFLAPEEDDVDFGTDEDLKDLLKLLVGDEFDEDDFNAYLAEEKELEANGGTCDDPECVCNDLSDDDDFADSKAEAEEWGEVLHEDDEYMIVRFQK